MVNKQPPIFREHQIEWDDKKVSRLWDYYARTLSPEIYFSNALGHHVLRHSGLPLGEPLEVLDFGCGLGFIWDHLNKLGSRWHYTGLDFSPDSVKKVIEKASGHQNFKDAQSIKSLPTELPDAHFDVVLLIEVVEHLNDIYLDSTLTEIARVLKKGGCLVITTPNEEELFKSKKFCPECGAIFHEMQHLRSWSAPTLSAYLKRHTFDLRMNKILDFNAQDFTLRGIAMKIKRMARKLMKTGASVNPHIIAVFQKK